MKFYIVLSMGKTGSMTLYNSLRTLKRNNKDYKIYHFHNVYRFCWKLYEIRDNYNTNECDVTICIGMRCILDRNISAVGRDKGPRNCI